MKSDESKKYTYHAGDAKSKTRGKDIYPASPPAPKFGYSDTVEPALAETNVSTVFTEPIVEAVAQRDMRAPVAQELASFPPPAQRGENATAKTVSNAPPITEIPAEFPAGRATWDTYETAGWDEAPVEATPREDVRRTPVPMPTDFGAYEAYYGKEYSAAPTVADGYAQYTESEYAAYEAAADPFDETLQPLVDMPAYNLDYFAKDTSRRRRKLEEERIKSKVRAKGKGRPQSKSRPQSKGRRVGKYVARTVSVVAIVLVAAVTLVFGAITVVCKGPFPTAQALFVNSVNETSAVKFLARIYFSESEVQEILAANAVMPTDEVTDLTQSFEEPTAEDASSEPIEIVDITGATYKGKMMIVKEPSRVKLATLPAFGSNINGKKVEDFVAENNAVAGFNAGGFDDPKGMGLGGVPLGTMIKDGVIISGSATTTCNMIGFTFDNQLLVGMMTGQEALDKGMRDAVYFEPTFIVNGNPAEVSGNGGGLNPRTVIGQRADGAVLILVIDGRQPHSMGASLKDCMDEMVNAGAINAANLDGGSSSVLIYEGEMINTCASLYGSRGQPAAWIVE